MTIKKTYSVGDTVWIYGIERSNKLSKGRVVKVFEINGYDGIHYVIAIPTHIEDLLEIRTWETMSQDEHGPIGMYREVMDTFESTNRLLRKTGYGLPEHDDDEVSQEQILAAIEKSGQLAKHDPLVLKENKPRRRRFAKKKKV